MISMSATVRKFLYTIYLLPFQVVWDVISAGHYKYKVALWYGATLAGAVSLPAVYTWVELMKLVIAVQVNWGLVISLAVLWAMISGASLAVVFFPNDDISKGYFRKSAVSITAASTSIFMTGLIIAFMVDKWYLACILGAIGAIAGSVWGGIVGLAAGRYIRRIGGLAENDEQGISGIDPEAISNALHQVEDDVFPPRTYHTDIGKLLVFTLPCWFIALAIGRIWALGAAILFSLIWIIWKRCKDKELTITISGISVLGQKKLNWDEIQRCTIDNIRYDMHFFYRGDDLTSLLYVSWNWLFASYKDQLSVVAQLCMFLDRKVITLRPGPIPSRQQVLDYLSAVEKSLSSTSNINASATLHYALRIAMLLDASDLLTKIKIMESKVALARGSPGRAFDLADIAIQQAEEYGNPELVLEAVFNKIQLLIYIAPRMALIDDLVEYAEGLCSKLPADACSILMEIRASRLAQVKDNKDVLPQIETELTKAKNSSVEIIWRRIRAQKLIDEADKLTEHENRDKLYKQAEADFLWLFQNSKQLNRTEQIMLAWCQYVLGNYKRSTSTLESLLKDSKKSQDFLSEALILWKRALINSESDYWESAYTDLRAACDRVESVRMASSQDWQKIGLLSGSRERIYEDMVKLCLKIPLSISEVLGIQNFEHAFEYMERSRSRALLDLLGTQRLKQEPKVTQAFREEAALNLLPSAYPANVLQQESFKKTSYDWAISNVSIQSVDAVSIIEYNTFKECLPSDSCLLEYYKLKDRWVVFVITHEGCTVHWLNSNLLDGAQLEEAVENFYTVIKNLYVPPETIKEFAKHLYQVLWMPVREQIEKYRIVYIIPYGILHRLPFSALYDGHKWLVESQPSIAYSPSANILSYSLKGNLPERLKFVGFANPHGHYYLPTAVSEVQACGKMYEDAMILSMENTKSTPSRDTFFQHAASADVLHLACHGRFINDPLEAGFLFSLGDQDDAWITAKDLFKTRLKARLVVASICHGSAGVLAGGDEWLGLLRSLIAAGVHSIAAARWAVDDDAQELLMIRFHSYLRSVWIAESMRLAAVSLMRERSHAYEHPFYWSSMSIWGDGGAIHL